MIDADLVLHRRPPSGAHRQRGAKLHEHLAVVGVDAIAVQPDADEDRLEEEPALQLHDGAADRDEERLQPAQHQPRQQPTERTETADEDLTMELTGIVGITGTWARRRRRSTTNIAVVCCRSTAAAGGQSCCTAICWRRSAINVCTHVVGRIFATRCARWH